MSDLLAAAAAAMNVPEAMTQRSAEARAKATGVSVDDILTAWAGGASTPAVGAAPEPTPSEPPAPSETAPPAPPADAPLDPAPAPAAVASTPPPSEPLPTPTTVTPEQALSYPVVVSVATAGLKERTTGALPRWLAAAFMVVPAFGLLYLSANLATGGCQTDGYELAIDRATGALENCDGSAFTGRSGVGGAGAAFLGEGGQLYTSAGCTGCHGADGAGGTGPAFANVLLTFGSCADHIEWVALGSAGFQAAGRTTYGDIAKPVLGGMPAHASLTDEQIASVVSFERVAFGGGVAEEVLTDCGLVEATGDSTAPAAAPEGDAPTTDSSAGA